VVATSSFQRLVNGSKVTIVKSAPSTSSTTGESNAP
jgi:hypothetical protein